MLNFKTRILAVAIALFSASALAHPGHDSFDVVAQPEAIQRADDILAMAIAKNVLDASWANKQLKGASTRDTANGPVWIVVFNNPREPDAAKRTVYIFLDPFGDYLGANFTGPPK